MESLETTDILETNEGVPMVSTSVKKTVKSAAPSKSSSSSPAVSFIPFSSLLFCFDLF